MEKLIDGGSGRLGPSLEWLINPLRREAYFEEYWEKKPLVINRGKPDYFNLLLSFSEVDRVITTLDRGYPNITLKNADKPGLTHADYTLDGGALDVARVYELFQRGSTITLAFLDTVIPELTLLCRSLESEFSCPLQTNVYMTPAGAQGASPHYDTHDVFVLQVAGSKRWTIFGTPVTLPLAGQEFDARVHEVGAATFEFELKAGDVAYIPRGVAHEARSTEAISLHITTGILRYTWADFLLEFFALTSLQDAALRKALPPGFARSEFDRTQTRETLRGLLEKAWNMSSFDAVLDGFIERFLSRCPPVLSGQLLQLARVDSLTEEDVAGARPGVIWRVRSDGASEVIETYGRTITFPSHAGEALRFALGHRRFVIRELPGRLDDAGKLTLIRRLIREGLVWATET